MEQLRFTLPDFTDGDVFPLDYTGRGKDISPEIVIENLSAKTKTLAVTLEDVSHPVLPQAGLRTQKRNAAL